MAPSSPTTRQRATVRFGSTLATARFGGVVCLVVDALGIDKDAFRTLESLQDDPRAAVRNRWRTCTAEPSMLQKRALQWTRDRQMHAGGVAAFRHFET